LELERLLADEAKARQGTRTDIVEKIPQGFESGRARDQAAKIMGVNPSLRSGILFSRATSARVSRFGDSMSRTRATSGFARYGWTVSVMWWSTGPQR